MENASNGMFGATVLTDRSQRLLKFLRASPAGGQFYTVAQDDRGFSQMNWAKLLYTIEVDDAGTMNPKETSAAEFLFHRVHSRA